MRIVYGITRTVFVTQRYVIKVPSFRSWKLFLTGLLSNMQERFWWSATGDPRLCPVKWSCPGGWFVVMPRVVVLGDEEEVDYSGYSGLPLDPKSRNFGWLGERLVMIDYGS